jgi:hypothetical protein
MRRERVFHQPKNLVSDPYLEECPVLRSNLDMIRRSTEDSPNGLSCSEAGIGQEFFEELEGSYWK